MSLVGEVTAIISVILGEKISDVNELSDPILFMTVKPLLLSKPKTVQRSAALFGTLYVVTVSL